jgi:hypothetical protein
MHIYIYMYICMYTYSYCRYFYLVIYVCIYLFSSASNARRASRDQNAKLQSSESLSALWYDGSEYQYTGYKGDICIYMIYVCMYVCMSVSLNFHVRMYIECIYMYSVKIIIKNICI